MDPHALDDILHALGRPDNPMQQTYRNYYCGEPCGADTPLWERVREPTEFCPDPIYCVTDYGREQAAKALHNDVRTDQKVTDYV